MDAKRLKDIRENRLKITQVRMAEIWGLSSATISNYERGAIDIPGWMECALFGLYFKINPDEIKGMTNE